MTTREDIRAWLDRAKNEGATHMLVACDSFGGEDYPVFVMPGKSPRAEAARLGNMQRVMECYDLALDIEMQLQEYRAFHWGDPALPPAREEKRFRIEITTVWHAKAYEIFGDNNGIIVPPDPTVADVEAAINSDGGPCGILTGWNLVGARGDAVQFHLKIVKLSEN